MNALVKRICSLLIILFFLAIHLDSQQKEWVCSLTSFSGTLSRENSFLFRHFPLLLYHRISFYETHYLSQEEKEYISRKEKEKEKIDLVNEWKTLLDKRDSLIFDADSEEYERLTRELSDIKAAESRLLKRNGERDFTQDELPLRIEIPGEGALLFDSREEALMGNADFVLSGFIGRAGDYLLIEVTGSYTMNGEILSLWTGAGTMDELDKLAREASDTIKTYLLGRPWSALRVDVQPGGGQIFLDGSPLGTGQALRETLVPGKAQLEVRLPGYNVYSEEIELLPLMRVSREITLSPGKEDLIEIITHPPGADVIFGSTYLGVTPLYVNRPIQEKSLSLVLSGYDRVLSHLGPNSSRTVEFTLGSGGINWEEQRLVLKDKFYNSLGWFTLSLAAPVILYGTAENQASLANSYAQAYSVSPTQDFQDKYNQAYDRFSLSYGAYWGSLAVSGILLGVSINHLVKYIKASEKSIEQKE